MINAEEFVLELNSTGESKNFKLGTVYDLFVNNTAKIQFDGEDAPSEKQYAYLASYTPKVFDRVLLAITGGTYVILGKIYYNVPPATGEELDRYLFDQKLVTMTKGLSVTGATALKSGATITGNLGVSGNITVAALTATGNVSGANLSTPGTITGNTITASGDVSGANVNSTGAVTGSTLAITGTASTYSFHHRGLYLSFFNKYASVPQQPVSYLSGTSDSSILHTKVNQLLQALKMYNLIG